MSIMRDVPQVLELLDVVFRPSLDAEGRRALNNSLSLRHTSWIMMRLSQVKSGLPPGFIWEEQGRIIGNVSLLTSRSGSRHLVANVAVHPSFRRRGIARHLMELAIEQVRLHQGRAVLLQVDAHNDGAIRLYEQLRFITLGSITTWQTSLSQIQPLPIEQRHPTIRPLRSNEWRPALALDRAVLHPDLNWPEPLDDHAYKGGAWRWLVDMLNGRQRETWVIGHPRGPLVALGSIASELGRPHQLSIRVEREWQGGLERPLLAKLLRRLGYLSRRQVRVEHPADDELMNQLLREANFQRRRTLTTMRLDL